MKILLVNLPKDGEVKDTTTPDYLLYDFMSYPPLGLLAIAADVNPRHNLQVLDAVAKNMTIKTTVDYIKDFQPNLLGITVVTRRLFPMYSICKKVKEILPNIKIIAGGPHINYFPRETMELGVLDYALTGYGEGKFSRFIEIIDINGSDNFKTAIKSIPGLYFKKDDKIMSNPPDEVPLNLDELPFPKRTLINLNDYFTMADEGKMTTMYSSRGCPFKCIFCDVQEKVFRYRSPEKIVDEFEYIAALGINEIHIFDDTFNLNRERVIKICKEIIKRKLDIKWSTRARVYPFDKEMLSLIKKAGCTRLHVGIESLDPNILTIIKKGITLEQIENFFYLCNEFKISTLAYFILGFPEETEEYRRALYNKIACFKPTYVYVNVLYPTPKSEFYNTLVNKEVVKDYWQDFVENPVRDFLPPLWRSEKSHNQLILLADKIHRKFYLSPRFVINDLKRTTSPKKLVLKAKAATNLFIKTTQSNRK